jgi:hypothetical protein
MDDLVKGLCKDVCCIFDTRDVVHIDDFLVDTVVYEMCAYVDMFYLAV